MSDTPGAGNVAILRAVRPPLARGSEPPDPPDMFAARVTAIEGRLDKIDGGLDRFEDRLRSLETGVAAGNAKLDLLVSKVPSWWQPPLGIAGVVAILGALLALFHFMAPGLSGAR